MLISVDFDGVICDHKDLPSKKTTEGEEPVSNSKEALMWLMQQGHEVYIQSARDKDEILIWLKEHDFPLLEITDRKKKGTSIYLDDRAVRFTNWKDFCKYLG